MKTKAKTPARTALRRLRWLGGPEPERYIPGVPARDLEESDIDRLDWIRSQGNATPVAADLVTSGLYSPHFPRGNAPEPVTPEVPAPAADVPATTPEE